MQGRSKFRNMCRIFVVSNAYKKEEKWFFLKDALWGGGTHRSWPGGRGGRPRALIPGGRGQGSWLGGERLSGRGVREGLGGGVQGLRFRGGRW